MITRCVFCSRQAIAKNSQNFPTCQSHKKEVLGEMKCSCKEFLIVKEGKYGAFFLCPDCGPVSISKALSINNVEKKNNAKRIITLRSDEVDLF